MQIRKVNRPWKIIVLSLIIVLGLPKVRRAEENPLDFSSSVVEVNDSLNSLEDFIFLPGSAVLVKEGYILALFENWRNGLYAVVVFAADCNQAGCTIGDFIFCSIFDPGGADAEDTDGSLQIKGQKIPQTHGFPELAFLTLA